MNVIILFVIGYFSLLLVIWLHEFGHALAYTIYGCKKNPFHVSVHPYIFFSTPLPVDLKKESKLSNKKKYHIGIAGILMNLIISLPLYFFVIKSDLFMIESYLSYFIYFFVLFHLVEAMTYMILNNIVVASDIKAIEEYKPSIRIPVFFAGLIILVFILDMYSMCPVQYKFIVGLVIVILSAVMGIARIIFQILISKKNNI
jgi:hypothetical protein